MFSKSLKFAVLVDQLAVRLNLIAVRFGQIGARLDRIAARLARVTDPLDRLAVHCVGILIKIYQFLLSPDHSWRRMYYPFGFCPFYPSCSQYAIDSFSRHGFWRGGWQAFRRILRCRPGVKPEYNPVQ